MERCLLGVEQLVPSAISRKSNPKWRTEKVQSGRNRWPVWRVPLTGVWKYSRDLAGQSRETRELFSSSRDILRRAFLGRFKTIARCLGLDIYDVN